MKTDKKGRDTVTVYDDMGRVDTVTNPDSSKTVNHYDNEGRLTRVENYDRAGDIRSTITSRISRSFK